MTLLESAIAVSAFLLAEASVLRYVQRRRIVRAKAQYAAHPECGWPPIPREWLPPPPEPPEPPTTG